MRELERTSSHAPRTIVHLTTKKSHTVFSALYDRVDQGGVVETGEPGSPDRDEGNRPDAGDQGAESRSKHRGVDRRAFLAGAGLVGGAAAADYLAHAAVFRGPLNAVRPRSLLGNPLLLATTPVAPTFTTTIRRREDLLFLRVDGYNLRRSGQKLVRKHPGQDATLVFTFVPQHLAEEAFFENSTNSGPGNETPKSPGATRALLAAPSRIAFTVPDHVHSVPFTLAGLLDWSKLQLSLVPAASYTPSFIFPHHARHPEHAHAKHPDHAHAARAKHRHSGNGKLAHAAAAEQPHAFRPGGFNHVESAISPVSPAPLPAPIRVFGPGKPPVIRAPEPTETSIELPWHLAISPIAGSHLSAPVEPLTANGATELWRTRLAKGNAPTAGDGGALRAVWNFDTRTFNFASPGTPTLEGPEPSGNAMGPFRTSLNPDVRYQIVKLTSDFSLRGRADVTAKRLWLTARGGFLDSDGLWDDPNFDLLEWKHQATLGRDQYVKVVQKGFLFPFGHRAVQITITERQFELLGGEMVATERQIVYLAVRQPILSYDPADTFGIANNSRDFPFRSLELKTLRTPNLDLPTPFVTGLFGGLMQDPNYVPTVAGTPFQWHFVGTDWVGRHIPFTAEAVFIGYRDGTHGFQAGLARAKYNSLDPNDPLRVSNLHGKTIAFAESLKTGDTDLAVKSISWGASPGAGGSLTQFQDTDTAFCYPTLVASLNGEDTGARAVVRLSSAEQASGGAPLHGNSAPAVAYYPPFVATGFSTSQQPTGNAGNVYMEIRYDASNATNLTFGNGSSGGVLMPNLQLQGISRSLGPVADLDNIFSGKFDPSSIFAGLSSDLQARILGGVTLSELIAPVESFLDGGTPEIPNPKALKITYTTDGTVVTTNVTWKPDIVENNPIVTKRGGGGPTSFELDATVTTDLSNPNNSTFTILGTLKNFVVNLCSTGDDQFIKITFNELTFSSAKGQQANINVNIHAVEFVGPLKFVEQLQSFMDFSGEGGPKIEIKPDGVSADLTVALPTIAVGLFSLSNVGVEAGFLLPFDGSPAVFTFGFSKKSDPFQLSIAIFGGGGYFTMKIGTDGVHEIDAGFDFGAMAAINLGVASGSVSLVAGFQFTYAIDHTKTPAKNTCVLTGYVKLSGNLSILGIVTMSLVFDLSLTYQETNGASEVTGTATVTLSISILFIHFSVSATATKTFENSGGASGAASIQGHIVRSKAALASSNGTPTFADQVDFSAWQSYCQAFGTY